MQEEVISWYASMGIIVVLIGRRVKSWLLRMRQTKISKLEVSISSMEDARSTTWTLTEKVHQENQTLDSQEQHKKF